MGWGDYAFAARSVATPRSSLFCLDVKEPAAAAALKLRSRGYDIAPVAKGSDIVGLVDRERLQRSGALAPGEVMEGLTEGWLLSAEAGFGPLLEKLSARPFTLLVGPTGIEGAVTPADLGRQPARACLYAIVLHVELTAAETLRNFYGPDQERALTWLAPGRRDKAEEALQQLRSQDALSDVVAGLQLVDLLTIARREPALRRGFRIQDTTSWQRDVVGPVRDLRNQAAHPTRSLLLRSSSDVAKLLQLIRRLEQYFEVVE